MEMVNSICKKALIMNNGYIGETIEANETNLPRVEVTTKSIETITGYTNRETYKDDPDIGSIFANKKTLLNAITDAIGPSGKMSVQEWASSGKALGIYTDKI